MLRGYKFFIISVFRIFGIISYQKCDSTFSHCTHLLVNCNIISTISRSRYLKFKNFKIVNFKMVKNNKKLDFYYII